MAENRLIGDYPVKRVPIMIMISRNNKGISAKNNTTKNKAFQNALFFCLYFVNSPP